MGLRNLTLPCHVVTVADGVTFTVRGLSPDDALGLYFRHAGQLSALFDQFAVKGAVTRDDVSAVSTVVIGSAPRVMAEIIAIASGSEPEDDTFEDDVKAALRLSAGVQMDALQKTADLTFSSDMPPGKFAAVVLALARSAAASLPPVQQT